MLQGGSTFLNANLSNILRQLNKGVYYSRRKDAFSSIERFFFACLGSMGGRVDPGSFCTRIPSSSKTTVCKYPLYDYLTIVKHKFYYVVDVYRFVILTFNFSYEDRSIDTLAVL